MKAAQLVLRDMQKYRQKVIDNPHYPRGKLSKETEFFWQEFHHREIEAVDRMIARQELRISGRERLLDDSEGQSDTAQQNQELSKDPVLRSKEEGKNTVRPIRRHWNDAGFGSGAWY